MVDLKFVKYWGIMNDFLIDLDKIFLEEIAIHNELIAISSELQTVFSRITLSGFAISDSISIFVDCIQKKEFDKARKILQDVVYSISNLTDGLVSAVDKLSSGVFTNGQKTNRDKID